MSEPVAVPIQAIKEALSKTKNKETPLQEHAMDDGTLNHLSYKATNQVPYIIDYFGLRDFYGVSPIITEMARELHGLVVKDDSSTTVAETEADLDALTQELNLKDNDAPFYKLKKALFIARIRSKQRDLESKKLNMLADSQIV